MAPIRINGKTADPASPDAPPELVSGNASDSNYILIQCTHRLADPQQRELIALGAQIQEIVDEDLSNDYCTYLCRYVPQELAAIQAKPFVVHTGVYPQHFVLTPDLQELVDRTNVVGASSVESKEAPGYSRKEHTDHELPLDSLQEVPHTVDAEIFLHGNADQTEQQLVQHLLDRGYVNRDSITHGHRNITLTVNPQDLPKIAALDSVRSIERVEEIEDDNDYARDIVEASNVYLNNPTGTYLGQGQIVTVADGGFDKGDPANVHPAFKGRVKQILQLGRTGANLGNDLWGHGTHVAGSAVGCGEMTVGALLDPSGQPLLDPAGKPVLVTKNVSGAAPQAELIFQSMNDATGTKILPANKGSMYTIPYNSNPNARVHSSSWGIPWNAANGQRPYGPTDAQVIDTVVWANPDLLIVRSAGNSGLGKTTTGAQSTAQIGAFSAAKNCITVGNSDTTRPNIDAVYSWAKNTPNLPNVIRKTSSRGPTAEGRTKPDLVAPGTTILSTQSQDPLCPKDTTYGISPDPAFWVFETGSSMAAPCVAGNAAVLRAALLLTMTPSAATLKALLIHGAVDCSGGTYGAAAVGAAPNDVQGFGRLNLKNCIALIALKAADADRAGIEELRLDSTATVPVRRRIEITRKSKKAETRGQPMPATLKVTCVWSDPPGSVLQNKLDFSVVADATAETKNGNTGSATVFDRVNNVQQVVWPLVPHGDVWYSVSGTVLVGMPQPFSIVWTVDYVDP
ncbi:hypothetical protein MMC11_005675 [Xylographa trunciseda]|nr:hypothetical protein [Xylographa trunciseda]